MPAYHYEPLLSPGFIRLLVLQPSASHDAELRGSLLHMTLAEADYDLLDPYTALSYVWGSDERPCLIFLDGKEFAITQSLHDALRDMRDATRARRIWADALCINQNDIPERNAQVKLMGKIYGLAASTIIYLGHLTEDAANVLAAITWYATEADNEIYDELTGTKPAADGDTEQAEVDALVEVASRDLLSRPWFQRVWVLQELVLSKSPWIQCGRQRVRWDDFCRRLLQKPTNLSGKYHTLLRVLDDMNETRRGRATGKGKSLWDILSMRRGFGVADPQDHVYSNLSIIDDLREAREYLEVDYEQSVQRLFPRVAAYFLSKVYLIEVPSRIPELIPYIHDMRPEERLQGLPSWVPDWRYPAPELVSQRHTIHTGSYYVLNNDGVPSILAHTGYIVGTIKSVSAVLPLDRGVVKALLNTGEHSHIRQALLCLYDGFAGIAKERGYIPDAVSLPWEGSESQHESLCKALGGMWVQLFEALDQQSNKESSGDEDFTALFSRWISDQASTRRLFLDTILDTYGPSFCYGFPRLLQRYLESTSDDGIFGRRLAVTDNGKCVIVPKQACKGDAVVVLCGSGSESSDGPPMLVVRQEEVGEFQALNATIRKEIIEIGVFIGGDYQNHVGICEGELPAQEDDCVYHCSVVGRGYVDSPPDSLIREFGNRQLYVLAFH